VTRVRNSTRALVVLSGVPLTALVAVPALADVPHTAYDAGPGLTVSETLGIYVGIPLLVMGVIYALVYGLTGRRGPRYPAGQPWTADPEWFGDQPAGPGQVEAGAAADGSRPVEGEGGARGQW
jgi:hypothetical protein